MHDDNKPGQNDSGTGFDDAGLDRALGRGLPIIADDGFSAGVFRRIRRQIWTRRFTLFGAAAAGLALALPYIGETILMASDQMTALANRLGGQNLDGLTALLGALPAKEALLQFSSQLTEIASNWSDPQRLTGLPIIVPVGIVALLTPLAVRMLER